MPSVILFTMKFILCEGDNVTYKLLEHQFRGNKNIPMQSPQDCWIASKSPATPGKQRTSQLVKSGHDDLLPLVLGNSIGTH